MQSPGMPASVSVGERCFWRRACPWSAPHHIFAAAVTDNQVKKCQIENQKPKHSNLIDDSLSISLHVAGISIQFNFNFHFISFHFVSVTIEVETKPSQVEPVHAHMDYASESRLLLDLPRPVHLPLSLCLAYCR